MPDEKPHKWISKRSGGDPAEESSYEMVTYCERCGIEHPGDEFLDRIPDCDAILWAMQDDGDEGRTR